PADVHLESGQRGSEFIMQFARDALGFFLARGMQIPRQRPKLASRLSQALLRRATFRNVDVAAEHSRRVAGEVELNVRTRKEPAVAAVLVPQTELQFAIWLRVGQAIAEAGDRTLAVLRVQSRFPDLLVVAHFIFTKTELR